MSSVRLPMSAPHVELVASILRNPFAQRYAARMAARRSDRDTWIHTADDVLGERLARLGGALGRELAEPGTIVGMPDVDAVARVVEAGLKATPYLWTEEVRLATNELELPRHIVSPRVLPQPLTWHTFETGIGWVGVFENGGRRYNAGTLDAILVRDAGVGVELFNFGDVVDVETGEGAGCILPSRIEYGKTYPDDFGEHARTSVGSVLALFAFLASPYIPKEQRRPSRAARREQARAGQAPDVDQHVTFVVLRRPATRKGEAEEPPSSVEWKHRWLVSGHLRAQWYPSEQAHRLIWIAPYLKGPEDAPMLEHAYKVAR